MKTLLLVLMLARSDTTRSFTAKEAHVLASSTLDHGQTKIYNFLKDNILRNASDRRFYGKFVIKKDKFPSEYKGKSALEMWEYAIPITNRLSNEGFKISNSIDANNQIIFEISW